MLQLWIIITQYTLCLDQARQISQLSAEQCVQDFKLTLTPWRLILTHKDHLALHWSPFRSGSWLAPACGMQGIIIQKWCNWLCILHSSPLAILVLTAWQHSEFSSICALLRTSVLLSGVALMLSGITARNSIFFESYWTYMVSRSYILHGECFFVEWRFDCVIYPQSTCCWFIFHRGWIYCCFRCP